MSLNSPMLSRRSAEIAARFGARAESYEQHAGLQRVVADHLARLLPDLERPRVLELGCGTGLFSRHLVKSYPEGRFILTDAAPAMIAECRRNLAKLGASRISYEVMDAGEAGGHAELDLIAASMTLHWLPDPNAALERLHRLLTPQGVLLYATLGPESFAEWREVLASESPPVGAHRHQASARRGRRRAFGARCGRAVLPPPHEGRRRSHPAGRLRAAIAGKSAPRHTYRRCPLRRPHHLARRLWSAYCLSVSRPAMRPA